MNSLPSNRLAAVAAIVAITLAPSVTFASGTPGDAIDRLFAAYRSGSVEQMLASYTPDALFEDVNQRHHFQGTEQLAQLLGGLVAVHHQMGLKEKRRVVSGDTVVVEYEYVGTLNGAALGQSVGKQGCPDLDYVLPTTSWYEVKNGKITRQRDFIDWATFLELRQTLLAAGTGE